jgi:hypothetical protein
MRELHEEQDDDCCEEDSYKGDHHVLDHTISLMNWLMLVVGCWLFSIDCMNLWIDI